MSALMERLESNASAIERNYARANDILSDAVKEAMPWAAGLAMQGKVPGIDRIERLATQLIAILIATERQRESGQQSSVAAIHNMKW